jgi:hypothetical protein
MHNLISKFYTAFASLNAEEMASCYHPQAIFNDEVFVNLKGGEPVMMWKMLIERSKGNLKINFSNVQENEEKGSTDWVAEYNFSATGKRVKNLIHAEFEFKDGLIYRHTDRFNLHLWASQAMGWKGLLFGRFGFFKRKLQYRAGEALKKYIQNQA